MVVVGRDMNLETRNFSVVENINEPSLIASCYRASLQLQIPYLARLSMDSYPRNQRNIETLRQGVHKDLQSFIYWR